MTRLLASNYCFLQQQFSGDYFNSPALIMARQFKMADPYSDPCRAIRAKHKALKSFVWVNDHLNFATYLLIDNLYFNSIINVYKQHIRCY
jgi:tRNA G26 N,N-dimethylase Trm1